MNRLISLTINNSQILHRQLALIVPSDPYGSTYQNRELLQSTILKGTQIQARDCRKEGTSMREGKQGRERERDRERAHVKHRKTHENHPIPQPKQGRGLSNIPKCGSSASLIRIYSSCLFSTLLVECPGSTKTP